MDYNQIKREYDSIRREIVKKNKKVKAIDAELDEIETSKRDIEAEYQKEYAEAKKNGIIAYKKKLLKPIEVELLQAEDKLTELKTAYEEEKKELTEENLLAQCSDQQSILAEVRESSELLQEKIQSAVGKRFYEELMMQLSSKTVELKEEDLPRVIKYFNRCSATLEKMSSGPSGLDTIMNGFENSLQSLNLPTDQNKSTIALILGAIIVITLLAYRFVFPVYMIFLVLLGWYNLSKTHTIYQILIVQKSVQDNIDNIDKLIHEQVVEELEKRIIEIDTYYDNEMAKVEKRIDELKNSLASTTMTAEHTYNFDDSELHSTYAVNLQRKENTEASLLQERRQLKKQLDDLYTQGEEYKKQLDDIVGGIQKQHLDFSHAGTEFIFNPYFLIDIDTDKSKPVYFIHQQVSSLFIYKSLDEVFMFLRLICAQLRCKLDPSCLSIYLYDETRLGESCIYFIPKDEQLKKSGTTDRMYMLFTDSGAFKVKIEEMALDIFNRNDNIKREFKNVDEYNKAMLELESLTLAYEFLFIVDPSKNILEDSNLKKILINGGNVGLFAHLFIEESAFKALGDSAKTLLESIEKIYLLQNGTYNERAKDFILDTFIKKG
ncbi:hypothetical protein AALB53_08220 [Lachnospiraceae bacterium 47-T17]